jgi:hypothetical protein
LPFVFAVVRCRPFVGIQHINIQDIVLQVDLMSLPPIGKSGK